MNLVKKKVRLIVYIIVSVFAIFAFFVSPISSNNHNHNNSSINLNSDTNSDTRANTTATTILVNDLYAQMDTVLNLKQHVGNVKDDELKKAIFKFIENPPAGFLWSSDIEITRNSIDYINGYINTSVSLYRWKNDSGSTQIGNFTPVQIKFGPFLPAPGPTSVNRDYLELSNYDSILPEQFYQEEQRIMELVKNNFVVSNLPPTGTIQLSNFAFSNSSGYVSFDIGVTNYFDDSQVYQEGYKLIKSGFQFRGFKSLKVTVIPNQIDASNQYWNVLASDMINNLGLLRQIIIDNSNSSWGPGFGPDDITIKNATADNINGYISIDLTYRNFYSNEIVSNTANADGRDIILVTTDKIYNNLIISGFKSISPTTISPIIQTNDSSILAQTLTNDDLVNIVLGEINKNGNDYNVVFDNIKISSSSITVDNLKGEISFVPQLDKYVDKNGELYNVPGSYVNFPKVTVQGFKSVMPTTFNLYNIPVNSLLTAQEAYDNFDSVKQIIMDNISGDKPDGFKLDNIIILDSSCQNINGSISVSFTLDLYYGIDGYMYNTSTFGTTNIILTGYKQVKPTEIKKDITINGVSNITPQSYGDDQLITYIKDNISFIIPSLPSSFDVDKNLSVTQINRFNKYGYIIAFLKVDCFYSNAGTVITNDSLSSKVYFRGFSTIKYTEIITSTNLESLNDISPNDMTNNSIVDFIIDDSNPDAVTSPLINNIPTGAGIFSKKNVFVNIVDIISTESESYVLFNLSLNTYYNKDGILVKNSNILLTQTNIRLYGFKIVEPTVIATTYNIPSSSNYSNYLASELSGLAIESTNGISVENLILSNPDRFFTCYPNDINITSVNILNVDNENGQLLVNISIINYYNMSGKTEKNIFKSQNILIKGFSKAVPTTIIDEYYLSDVYTKLPTDMTKSEIKKIIYDNKNFIFNLLPNDFSESDLQVDLTSTSYNNLDGRITAKITLYNYFDDFFVQQKDIPLVDEIVLIGFKSQRPTSINSTFVNTDVGASYISPYDVTIGDLLELIYNNQKTIFANAPALERSDIIISTNNVIKDNINGKIHINPLKITKYYDDNGKYVNNNVDFFEGNLTITGYHGLNISTTINDQVDLSNTTYASLLPSEITPSILQEIVFSNNVIENKTPSFILSDIFISEADINYDNNQGQIICNVKIKNYYKDDGQPSNSYSDLLTKVVTFFGLKTSVKTAVIKEVTITGIDTLVASEVSDDYLLSLVRKNYTSIFIEKTLTANFSTVNIVNVTKDSYDNSKGTINLLITLNNYYDENGIPISNGRTDVYNTTIIGFKKNKPTILKKENIDTKSKDTLVSSLSDNDLIKIVYDNRESIFSGLPTNNFSTKNISIISNEPNNITGETKLQIELNYYIDENGEYVYSYTSNDNTLKATITLTGFRQVQQTIINPTFEYYSPSLSPTDISSDGILKIIEEKIASIIQNPYSNQTLVKDISISNINRNNANGTITFTLSLNKYFNEKGEVVTNGFLSQRVTISGFKSIFPTLFKTSVDLDGYDNYNIPQSIMVDDLINIIINQRSKFFDFLPEKFSKDNIAVNEIKSYDNKKGSLTASLRVNNYIDSEGFLQTTKPYEYDVVINGFKKIKTSLINQEVELTYFSAVPNDIPSNFYNNQQDLKDLIIDNRYLIFDNMPPSFDNADDFSNKLTVSPVKPNNMQGSILVKIAVSEYYNEEGVLISNSQNPLEKQVVLSGLNTTSETKVLSSYDISNTNYSNNYASHLSESEYETIIKNHYINFITNLAPGFNADNIVRIVRTSLNDIEGSAEVSFVLTLYSNSQGEICNNNLPCKIKLVGFRKKEYSKFNTNKGELSLGTFDIAEIGESGDHSYVTPSAINNYYTNLVSSGVSLDEQKQKVNDWIKRIIKDKFTNLSGDYDDNVYVEYLENKADDLKGYIEASVVVKKYVSLKDGGDNTRPFNFIVKIYGFKIVNASIMKQNNKLIITLAVLGSVAGAAIIATVIFIFRFRIWRKSI